MFRVRRLHAPTRRSAVPASKAPGALCRSLSRRPEEYADRRSGAEKARVPVRSPLTVQSIALTLTVRLDFRYLMNFAKTVSSSQRSAL